MPTPLDAPIVCPITVGREAHLSAVERLLGEVAGGHGRTLLVTGEAGIGKSRLVSELRERAVQRGLAVVQGHCFESDRALPYAPFVDLLRSFLTQRATESLAHHLGPGRDELIRLVPELAADNERTDGTASLDPEQQKQRLFQALTGLIGQLSQQRPLIVIIEDVHWADETSLELLRSIARSAVQRALLLVVTYRADEITDGLRALLTSLDRERLAVELRLQQLSLDELDAMLRAIFRLERPTRREFLDLLHAQTEGNPFFVEEVLRALIGVGDIFVEDGSWDRKPVGELRVPRSVDDAVQRRTAQLSSSAREVVALAAVAGRRFEFELLRALTGDDESRLLEIVKELIGAGLVVEESADQFAFRHALTRQAIYSSLLARERRILHRRVAEALEEQAETRLDELAADLAYHAAQAGLWQPALRYGVRAGERALRMYAPRAAVEQLTRALDAAHQLGLAPDIEVFRLRGQAYELLGEFEAAQRDFDTALSTARAAGDRPAEWQALLDLSLLWAGRSYPRTGDYATQALELARSIGDPRLVAQTLNRVGNWHLNVEHLAEAQRDHQEALRLFEQLGDERGRAETLDLLGMASNAVASRSAAYYAEAIPLLRKLDDRPRLVTSLIMRMLANGAYLYETTPVGSVTTSEAIQLGEEALRIARDIGWPAGESFVLWELALWLGPRGAFQRALHSAQAGLALAIEIDHRQWMAAGHAVLGIVYLDMGLLEESETHLVAGLRLAQEIGSTNFASLSSAGCARVRIAQRRYDEANALLDSAIGTSAAMDTLGRRWCWLVRAELELARGDAARALDILDRLIQSTEAGVAIRVWQVRGEALGALGRATEAVDVLESARAAATKQGARAAVWRIEASLARTIRGLGRRDDAERVLAAARSTVEAMAAELDDPRLRTRFLRLAAEVVPAPPPATPGRAAKQRFGGLTGREREVARLIARGLSNRAIADQLVLGERTVESYVGNILSKLGFGARTQIAAWVVESGLGTAAE
ncbi:MAG TPA: BREX system ATP-binding domain-containing protein [Chloroflexota bacterium]